MKNYQLLDIRLILILAIAAAVMTWLNSCELIPAIAPDDWVYHPPKPDTVQVDTIPVDTISIDTIPIDSVVIELDTVCTTYTDIINPLFATCYMEFIPEGLHFYTLFMFPFKDTIYPGDDIEFKLDSMTKLFVAYYNLNITHEVFVNDADDKIYSIMFTGTDDVNKFLGKYYLRYGNTRHHFGSVANFYHSPSYTCEDYEYVVKKYPSVRYANWRDSPCDSLEENRLAWMIIDTANCKGGRDWLDFWFNSYQIDPYVKAKALEAKWYLPSHGIAPPPSPHIIAKNDRSKDIGELLRSGVIVIEIE